MDGDHNNFGPRAGFAFQVSKKLVLRGGYGLFYGERDQNQQVTQFSGNFPNTYVLASPTITAANTVAPPYTVNTPIPIVPATPSLAGFTAASPFVGTLRTQAFDSAADPMVHQYNFNMQYQLTDTLVARGILQRTAGTRSFEHVHQCESAAVLGCARRQEQAGRPAVLQYQRDGDPGLFEREQQLQLIRTSGSISAIRNGLALAGELYDSEEPGSTRLGARFLHAKRDQHRYGYLQPGAGKERRSDRCAADSSPPAAAMRCHSDPDRRWLSQGLAGKLIGGWQLNAILTLRGGFPTNIRTNVIPPIFNTFNVPDAVAGQPLVLPQSWRGRIFQSRGVDRSRHHSECDRRSHSTVRNSGTAGGAGTGLEKCRSIRIQGFLLQ